MGRSAEQARKDHTLSSFGGEDRRGEKPPSFDRVISGLTNREIADEIIHNRGGEDYQQALRTAAEKRGIEI